MICNIYKAEDDIDYSDSRIKELLLSSNTFLLSFIASILILCLPFIWLTFVFKWVDYIQLPLFAISLPLAVLYFLYGVKAHHVKKLKKTKIKINFNSFSARIDNLDMLFFVIPFVVSLLVFFVF